jgi:hypothetical protein
MIFFFFVKQFHSKTIPYLIFFTFLSTCLISACQAKYILEKIPSPLTFNHTVFETFLWTQLSDPPYHTEMQKSQTALASGCPDATLSESGSSSTST